MGSLFVDRRHLLEGKTVEPRVSIVIPAFNAAPYIEAAVESVLAQTYSDFEVVIADHSSTDGTWEILQRYASHPRVRLARTPTGGGAEANWNRVSQLARGEWIKLVCADDVIYPALVEVQMSAVDSAPDGVVLVASPRDVVDANGSRVMRGIGLGGLRGRVSGRAAIRRAVRRGTNIFGEPCCTLVRRDVLEGIGWWDGKRDYLLDEATYLKVLLQGDLLALPESLSAFRINSAQLTVSLTRQQARDASAVHQDLLEARPDVLTATDVRLGNARAYVRASQRRLVYYWLRRRLTPAGGAAA